MDNLSKKGFVLKEIFRQLDPGTIRDIINLPTSPDAFRVLLQDGQMLLARLGQDNVLRLDEIDPAC